MKDIKVYKADKYDTNEYEEVKENIYRTIEKKDKYSSSYREANTDEKKMFKSNTSFFTRLFGWKKDPTFGSLRMSVNGHEFLKESGKLMIEEYEKKNVYVTSLSFVQEEDLGEGIDASNISQYPLEDLLDEYFCYISDYYEDLNKNDSKTCYLEFQSTKMKDIEKLLTIVGKHVYDKEDGDKIKLVVE